MSSSRPPSPASNPEQAAEAAVVETTATVEDLSLKQKAGDAANRWMARNRSLVLRQTPIWAQSLAAILIGLSTTAVIGGILFRIDEVVTVQGQLKSIGGTVEVKTPAGGRVAEVLFSDGEAVRKGQPLMRFDTRQATDEKETLTQLIAAERKQLKTQLDTLASQEATLAGRRAVLQQRMVTQSTILREMESLVEQGGFQRPQFLQQQDQLFELENDINDLKEQESRLKFQAEDVQLQGRKSIDQMRNRLRGELQLVSKRSGPGVGGCV